MRQHRSRSEHKGPRPLSDVSCVRRSSQLVWAIQCQQLDIGKLVSTLLMQSITFVTLHLHDINADA